MQNGFNNANDESPSFYLVPINSAAREIIEHNARYVRQRNGEDVLHIFFGGPGAGRRGNTIQLGRDPASCHIVIPSRDAGIHSKHCCFKCNWTTGAVVLHAQSQSRELITAVFDDEFFVPISRNHLSVVITRGFNRRLHLGRQAHYQFQVVWDNNGIDPIMSFLSMYPNHFGPQRQGFDPSTARYLQGAVIGHGAYGTVHNAINIRDGTPMAVKRYHSLDERRHDMAVREIRNMLALSSNGLIEHDHILNVLDFEYGDTRYPWIEVFMPLMEGSVKLLIGSAQSPMTDYDIGNMVLYQMAEALKYMAGHSLIHRDVKPENILYETIYNAEGGVILYHFRLADFGLSNDSALARTIAGTPMFMAPEVYNRQPQTTNTDIWSLFVTIAWIYDVGDFRDFSTTDPIELHTRILDMAQDEAFASFRDMAEYYPQMRVTASLLVDRLRAAGMQPINEILQSMTQVHDGGRGQIIPDVPQSVMDGFEYVHGSPSSHRQPATMDGHSAMGEFYDIYDDVSTVEYPAARVNSDPQTPRPMPRDGEELQRNQLWH